MNEVTREQALSQLDNLRPQHELSICRAYIEQLEQRVNMLEIYSDNKDKALIQCRDELLFMYCKYGPSINAVGESIGIKMAKAALAGGKGEL